MERPAPDPVIGESTGASPGFEVEGAVILVPLLFETAEQADQLVTDQQQAAGVPLRGKAI